MNKSTKFVLVGIGIIAIALVVYFGFMKDAILEDKSGGGTLQAHFTDEQGNPVPILTAKEFLEKYGFLPQSFLSYVNIDPSGADSFAYGVANVYFTVKSDATGSSTKVRTWIKSATQTGSPSLFPTTLGTLPTAKFTLDPAGSTTCGAGAKCYSWASTTMPVSSWASAGGTTIDFSITVDGEYEFPANTWTDIADNVKTMRIVFYTDPAGTYTVTFNPTAS